VLDLRAPLQLCIHKGLGSRHTHADKEDVCAGVAERSQTVEIFLTGCIPKSDGISLLVDGGVDGIVVKHSGDVLTREFVVDVRDQKACLSDRTIADNDDFNLI